MNEAILDGIVKEMPVGCELFIRSDVASDMFGLGANVVGILDGIAQRHKCHFAVGQSFGTTPEQEGYRFCKTESYP